MSINVSKKKREDLLRKISEINQYIAKLPQDEGTRNILLYLNQIEKEINGKKYGLIFEEHREKIDDVLDTHTAVLTEDKQLFVDNGSDHMNFLIEGDNLASLKILEKTHRGKVDLIYIDPPYNRGVDDFKYDDNYITRSDGYIHSKWISFMNVRLKIAKRLLSDSGVIFLSIDDNEQANLRLLCDTIFGEQNFAGMMPWRKRTAKTDVPFGISQDFEWIMIYAKSELFNAFTKRKNVRKYYETQDMPGRPWRIHDLTKQTTAEERPNSYFTIVNPRNGEKYPANRNRTWAITKETFNYYLQQTRIVFPGDYDFLKISKPQLRYFKDEDEGRAIKKTGSAQGISAVSTQLPDFVGMTKDGTKDLGRLFDEKVFPFPKPVELIKYIISIGTIGKENALILDFFAGSGTTGQAVFQYNAENETSNRRFILCTNNENNICREVTYERIIRAIRQEKYVESLKYYKIDYVPTFKKFYYEYAGELLLHIPELIELENSIDCKSCPYIRFLLTEREVDEFVKGLNEKSTINTIYLGPDILLSGQQLECLNQFGIITKVVPDYYYKDLEG